MDDKRELKETSSTDPAGGSKLRIAPKSPREALSPEPAPQPPRSKSAHNPIVVVMNAIITLVVFAVIAAGAVLYWGKAQFDQPGPLKTETVVLIPSDSGVGKIADILETNGVIANPYDYFGHYIFMAGVRVYQVQGKLKAGEYAFPAGASMRSVMDLLVAGKAIMHQVTLPEGLTSQQIVERLKANDVLTGPIAKVPDEGTLLPETYTFTRGTTREQILTQMRAAHGKTLAEIWENRTPNPLIETPEQLVTLASIVEKETGKADERPHVASVFLNRLAKGIRLQSDPTIIYGIVAGAGTLGRSITRSDIDRVTPYNTYHIDGLPPGPIANPGRAALEAVANPSATKDLYFVADGTGGHVFAATLADHNRNVAKWRKLERAKVAAAGKAEADTKDPDAVDLPPDAEVDDAADATATPAKPEASDPLDLLDGEPHRDPNLPVLPVPKPK
ncbi:endolytic transglycosylase MltG [Oryzibacter oryziterrae]|uniref:endolytic transglycosylase MltG n=1 Tax=Oryzibacter oryziterrae TaxID=2766474 RepID=UPI001F0160BA|nr:endolytic transglycosylase MltG [Oryzibacter oryziterrae]